MLNRHKVTDANIEVVKNAMSAIDQASELVPGCITWGIVYSGGQRGQMTIWPDDARGAVAWGSNSQWGDWDDTRHLLFLDSGGVVTETGVFFDLDDLERLASMPFSVVGVETLTAWWRDSSGLAWALPCYRAVSEHGREIILWTHAHETGRDNIVTGSNQSLRAYAENVASQLGDFLCIDPDNDFCADCGQPIRWGHIITQQWKPNRIYGCCGCEGREWIQEERGGEWILL